MDVELLARIQFALTIMFHYLFPPLSIGLGWIMVVMEGLHLKTKLPIYEEMARFWTKVFALNFALGVASGIVMEFQFGTNWAAYSRFVGDVFGSALAAEGIFAFFLESGFLAVLVFGWDRVSKKMHFFSTLMVASGATFSAVWIVVANSWQQTPAGYHVVEHNGVLRAEITDFWAMVFNPSSMHRLNHVLIGALLTGAFVVMSISAWYLLKNRHTEFAKRSMRIALVFAMIFAVLAPISGHFQAEAVAVNQPPKLAAFEGHFKQESDEGAPLWLFGWPNETTETVDYGIAIPGGLSFLLHQNFHEPVEALEATPKEDWPPVGITFASYHLMIITGMAMLALAFAGNFYAWRGTLQQQRWLLWCLVPAALLPYIANHTGWIAAEVGRQPWIVWGELRTADALSAAVGAEQVLGSIIMFMFIYAALFALYIYVLNEKIQHGPEPLETATDGGQCALNVAAGRDGVPHSMTSMRASNSDDAG